jgi:hypothetical protein
LTLIAHRLNQEIENLSNVSLPRITTFFKKKKEKKRKEKEKKDKSCSTISLTF